MMLAEELATTFEAERPRLRAVATGIVGSVIEADDVVQDAWFRLARAESSRIENLSAWLTVVVTRIALDHVRARASRREAPLDDAIALRGTDSAEADVLLGEAVFEALSYTLDQLSPLESVAFILHDLFLLPFDEIAAIIDRSSAASRKLASRARAKVTSATPSDRAGRTSHRAIVEAFMLAARNGDLNSLLALLAPDAVLRADETTLQMGGAQPELQGANDVAAWFNGTAKVARMTWFDGIPGAAWAPRQQILVGFTFEIVDGKVAEIWLRSDPDWLASTDVEIEPRPRRKIARR